VRLREREEVSNLDEATPSKGAGATGKRNR